MKREKIRILNIAYYMCCPPKSGGTLRMLNPYIKMTEEDNILVDFVFSTWDDGYADDCRKYLTQFPAFNSVIGVKCRHYLDIEIGCPSGFSSDVWTTLSKELREKTVELARSNHYDIIQIEHSQLAWIVPALRVASPHSKFVLDLHNAEHLISKRWLDYATPDERNKIEKRYNTLYDWECMAWKWFDAAFAVSDIEARMLKDLGKLENVFVVPTGGGIDVEKYKPTDENGNKPYDLLYLGTMMWYPNAHGLLWFINKVFPVILSEMPDVTLNIVGFGSPDAELVKISNEHSNIKFWGEQKDDKHFFHNSKVFIVPLWIGAGARVKIPTAWASKIPIVTTYLGAEGLKTNNAGNIIMADDPYEFAAAVLTLLKNEGLRERIITNAFNTVNESYTIRKCIELLKEGYDRIIDTPNDTGFFFANDNSSQENELNFYKRLTESDSIRVTLNTIKDLKDKLYEQDTEINLPKQKLNPDYPGIPIDNVTKPSELINHIAEEGRTRLDWGAFCNMQFLFHFVQNSDRFDYAYSKLYDNESKDVMLKILKHRLTYNIQGVKTALAPVRETLREPNLKLPVLKDLNDNDYCPWDIFFREQYIIPGLFEVKAGDVIIDGGGYIGDTAAFFSQLAGNDGIIYSFEAHPLCFNKLSENIANNNISNVLCIQKALGKQTGKLMFSDDAHGSTIRSDGTLEVDVLSIDEFVNQSDINRVSLIKLDIEGSEDDAINGARNTIKKFKPKLAVSVYHKMDDYYNLMELISEIDNSYKFAMRHTSEEQWETVIFAFHAVSASNEAVIENYEPKKD
jgi:FkbM family methyltransferase